MNQVLTPEELVVATLAEALDGFQLACERGHQIIGGVTDTCEGRRDLKLVLSTTRQYYRGIERLIMKLGVPSLWLELIVAFLDTPLPHLGHLQHEYRCLLEGVERLSRVATRSMVLLAYGRLTEEGEAARLVRAQLVKREIGSVFDDLARSNHAWEREALAFIQT